MSCTPPEILDIAKELRESSNEARLRASIGRSYYCAFHSCLNDLGITDTRQWLGGKGGVHEKLADEYIYGGNKPVGYMLASLKAKRNLADYRLTEDITQDDAKSALKSVEKLLTKIKP